MAKISAKKSNLKTIANKIIVSPNTDAVADLKFKRRKDFSTFVKWIDSSNKALDRIKLPSKKEVEKLGKLIEDIDFNDEFESNVKTIKESYFDNSAKETVQLDEQVVASEGEESGSTDDKIVDPTMAAYSAAIKRVNPL